jgi:hypothetical protein
MNLFLRQLYASTRLEFQFLGDPGQLEALLNMQFNLQRQQYEAGYPDAEDNIIFCVRSARRTVLL